MCSSDLEARLPGIPETVPVENGQSKTLGQQAEVPVVRVPSEDVKLLLGAEDQVKTIYRGKKSLSAPVKEGEKIGEIQYQVNGETWKKEEVVAGDAVEEIDYSWCLEQTMNRWAKGGT